MKVLGMDLYTTFNSYMQDSLAFFRSPSWLHGHVVDALVGELPCPHHGSVEVVVGVHPTTVLTLPADASRLAVR